MRNFDNPLEEIEYIMNLLNCKYCNSIDYIDQDFKSKEVQQQMMKDNVKKLLSYINYNIRFLDRYLNGLKKSVIKNICNLNEYNNIKKIVNKIDENDLDDSYLKELEDIRYKLKTYINNLESQVYLI